MGEIIPKNPAHAVHILESLVKDGEACMKGSSPSPWYWDSSYSGVIRSGKIHSNGKILASALMAHGGDEGPGNMSTMAVAKASLSALVEGTKMILTEWYWAEKMKKEGHPVQRQDRAVMLLAQAYAPRMAEVGMEVPDA